MTETALAPYQFTIDAAIAEWLAQKETRTHGMRNEINSSRRRTLASPCEDTALVAFLGFQLQ